MGSIAETYVTRHWHSLILQTPEEALHRAVIPAISTSIHILFNPVAMPEALNQSWSIDFMHDALTCGRRFRTFNVVDDFNREALAIAIDLNIRAQRVVWVLDRLVARRGYPLKMRMDNGPEHSRCKVLAAVKMGGISGRLDRF